MSNARRSPRAGAGRAGVRRTDVGVHLIVSRRAADAGTCPREQSDFAQAELKDLPMKRRRMVLWRAAVLLAVCTTAWADDPVSSRSDQPLLDAYGDPLPPDALLRLGTTRFHHQSWIRDAAIAPDGRMLASAAVNQDVGIALWEIPSGRLLVRLMPAGDRPPWTNCLVFSPDGKKLLTGDVGGKVHLWSLVTGDELYSIEAHPGHMGVTAVAFSRDGQWIASGGADCVVRVWSADRGRELLSFDALGQPRGAAPAGLAGAGLIEQGPAIASLAFSPDARLLAAGISQRPAQSKGGKIRAWDLQTNQPVSSIDDRPGDLESLVFTPDGRQLIAGGNVTIPREQLGRPYAALNVNVVQVRVWDVDSGKMVRELATPQPEVGAGALALSNDGRTLAVGYEHKISIWDFEDGKIRRSIDVPPMWRGGRGLSISADGRTVCAPLGSHTMGVWNATSGELLSPKSPSHTSSVLGVGYADDGRSIVTAGDDATVRAWNASDGRQRWAKRFDRTHYLNVMTVSPDGGLAAAAGSAEDPEAGVHILRTATGDEVRFIDLFAGQFHYHLYALAISPDSRLVAIVHTRHMAGDGAINFYDLTTGKQVAAVAREAMLRYPYAMVFSPDSASLVTVHDSAAVNVWDTTTGKPRHAQFIALKPSQEAPDQKRQQRRIPDAAPRIAGAALAPDLKTLVTSKGRELLFWDVQSGEMTGTMPSESADEGGSIAFSPDGRLLLMVDRAFTGSDAVRVFDVESRRVVAKFDSGQGRPRCFAFSPDGTRLVTGMDDGTALVWDLATSRPGSH